MTFPGSGGQQGPENGGRQAPEVGGPKAPELGQWQPPEIGELPPPQPRRRPSPTRRTWLVRLGIAIAAGLGIGAAAGVVAVNRFDPGRAGQPDSLQLMLDSLSQRKSNDPRSLRRAADSTDAAQRAQRVADSAALANDPDAAVVPAVLNLEEGAARDSIEAAGFTVGDVSFQRSTAPLGVVIATVPAAGQRARAKSAVKLILSDGKPPSDTADSHPAIDHSSSP